MPNCGVAQTIVRLVITGAAACATTPTQSAKAPTLSLTAAVRSFMALLPFIHSRPVAVPAVWLDAAPAPVRVCWPEPPAAWFLPPFSARLAAGTMQRGAHAKTDRQSQ